MTTVSLDHPELVTQRQRLRPLRRGDAGLVHLYASDARVARMTTSIPHPYPPGGAEAFIERLSRSDAAETVLALDTGGDNGLIGLVSLAPRADGTAALSYWVAPAFWNAGYAGEAVEAVVDRTRRLGLAALTAETFQDNLPSARVLTRAGFAFEGEGAAHSVARGAVAPTFRYRLALR